MRRLAGAREAAALVPPPRWQLPSQRCMPAMSPMACRTSPVISYLTSLGRWPCGPPAQEPACMNNAPGCCTRGRPVTPQKACRPPAASCRSCTAQPALLTPIRAQRTQRADEPTGAMQCSGTETCCTVSSMAFCSHHSWAAVCLQRGGPPAAVPACLQLAIPSPYGSRCRVVIGLVGSKATGLSDAWLLTLHVLASAGARVYYYILCNNTCLPAACCGGSATSWPAIALVVER